MAVPSVSDEVTALKNGVTNAVRAAICQPTGTGSPPNCIQDLWTGVGGTGYSGSFGEAYRNREDMQPDPAALSSRILTSEPQGCCARTTKLGLWSTASGLGNVTINCSVGSTYSSTGSCATSPAGEDGIGYPCFRPDALRAVMNEGAPLGALPFEMAVMTLWGVLGFALALRLFRWR